MDIEIPTMTFIETVETELNFVSGDNIQGKISFDFINDLTNDSEKIYLHPTPNMRICILKLKSGHEVYGVAQVLDANNDIEEVGNKIAFDRARDELWQVVGAIAKAL